MTMTETSPLISRRDEVANDGPVEPLQKQPPKVTPLPKMQMSILLLLLLCEPIAATVVYPFVAQVSI